MIEVVEALSLLRDVVLFSPAPICGEGAIRYCYCGCPATLQMVQCDECDEWYHYKCAGIRAADVRGDAEFECGYCRGNVNGAGLQVWAGEVFRGRKVVKKVVIPDRDPNSAPAKRSKKKGGHQEWFGPHSWAELVEQIRDHAAEIKKKIEKQVRPSRAWLVTWDITLETTWWRGTWRCVISLQLCLTSWSCSGRSTMDRTMTEVTGVVVLLRLRFHLALSCSNCLREIGNQSHCSFSIGGLYCAPT